MKKIAMVFLAGFAVFAAEAALYRVTPPGGEGVEFATLAEAVAAANANPGSVVEAMEDDDTSFTEEVTVTAETTFRSGGGARRTIVRKSAEAQFTLKCDWNSATAGFTVTFADLVLDGGARYANAEMDVTLATASGEDDPNLATVEGSVDGGQLIMMSGKDIYICPTVVLEDGLWIRNMFSSGSKDVKNNWYHKGVVGVDDSGHAGNIEMRAGAKISECRGHGPVLVAADWQKFTMTGGEISGCYYSCKDSGRNALIYINGAREGDVKISGGKICGNVNANAKSNAGALIHFAAHGFNGQQERTAANSSWIGGDVEISGNVSVGRYTIRVADWAVGHSLGILGSPAITNNVIYNGTIGHPNPVLQLGEPVESNVRHSCDPEGVGKDNLGEEDFCPVFLLGDLGEGARVGVTSRSGFRKLGMSGGAYAGARKIVRDNPEAHEKEVAKILPKGDNERYHRVEWLDGTRRELEYSCEDVLGRWTGEGQSFEMEMQLEDGETVTVKYVAMAEGPWTEEKPAFTEKGVHKVYYTIEGETVYAVTGNVVVAIGDAASGGEAGTYRVTLPGGEVAEYARIGDAMAAVNGCEEGGVVVELMRDDNVTFDGGLEIRKSFTFRSGPGGPYKLTRAGAEAGFTFTPEKKDGRYEKKTTFKIEGLRFDGGAVWRNGAWDPHMEDEWNLAAVGVKRKTLFLMRGTDIGELSRDVWPEYEFAGCKVENVFAGDKPDNSGYYGGVFAWDNLWRSGAKVKMEGVEITGCRGTSSMINIGDSTLTEMRRVVCRGNYLSKWVYPSKGIWRGRAAMVYLNGQPGTVVEDCDFSCNFTGWGASAEGGAAGEYTEVLHMVGCSRFDLERGVVNSRMKNVSVTNNVAWVTTAGKVKIYNKHVTALGTEIAGAMIGIEGEINIFGNRVIENAGEAEYESNLVLRWTQGSASQPATVEDNEASAGGVTPVGAVRGRIGVKFRWGPGLHEARNAKGGKFAWVGPGVGARRFDVFYNELDARRRMYGRVDRGTGDVFWATDDPLMIIVR